MKKITDVTTVFICLESYHNWYCIKNEDILGKSHIVICGKLYLLKLIIALIKLFIFNKSTVIKRYRKED